ncbi:phosphopantetheine-binding protein [Gordonia polyisoprenivorans]|uniref:phosphopantetheine-binding protein n=1 Tax=Gordonia polyisoprenivorans TaxID=84595 RepID=UPI001AD7CD76|nr:phosphopantetheine-binding protein [Gordonia polyisoprenivorans]QTI67132.1 isochorismatase [Gordonia polyisoprenivorans]
MASVDAVVTRDRIIGDIAEILDVPAAEITDDTNVLDIGLDSVRLMSLIERWRAAGATRADLVALAADPVVGSWVRELSMEQAR